MVEKLPITFIASMKHYFGFKPGQNLSGFRDEIAALQPDDKEYFIRHLRGAGYSVDAQPA